MSEYTHRAKSTGPHPDVEVLKQLTGTKQCERAAEGRGGEGGQSLREL